MLIHGASGGVGVFAVQLATVTARRSSRPPPPPHASSSPRSGRRPRYRLPRRAVRRRRSGRGRGLRRRRQLDAPALVADPEAVGRIVTIAADSEGTADERTERGAFYRRTERRATPRDIRPAGRRRAASVRPSRGADVAGRLGVRGSDRSRPDPRQVGGGSLTDILAGGLPNRGGGI